MSRLLTCHRAIPHEQLFPRVRFLAVGRWRSSESTFLCNVYRSALLVTASWMFTDTRLLVNADHEAPPQPKTLTTSTEPAPAVSGRVVAVPTNRLKYADVGINLSDDVYRGKYHGKQVHEDDTEYVLQRAVEAGCIKLMVTGSDLEESKKALKIAEEHRSLCYATVGVHPCSANTFDTHPGGPSKLLQELERLALEAKERGIAIAFGEIGLDYDRLFLTGKEQQLKYFEAQLEIAVKVQLPLFLHSRAAGEDFERLLKARLPHLPRRGLVHSFTGTTDEMKSLVVLGLDIGVNGCSMKTEESLDVVRAIPLERLQIETDGPWCEMRPSHASAKYNVGAPLLPKVVKKEKWEAGCMVKGRTEPATISHVVHAIAKVKGMSIEEVCEAVWNNSIQMFGLGERTHHEVVPPS